MIEIKLDTKDFDKKINNLEKGLDNTKKVLKEIEVMQLKELKKNFKTEGKTVTGGKWAKLQPSTIAEKKRLGFPNKILTRTGKMGKNFGRESISNNELSIKNSSKYSKYHQTGTVKMKKRQILGHGKQMISEAEKIYKEYIDKLLK